MKKILLIIISCFLLVGCALGNGPKAKVERYLNKYIKQDQDIMAQLDDYIANENLNDTQKNKYTEVLKKQYKNLDYKVVDEVITDNTATVTVEIDVYDFYKTTTDIDTYYQSNPTKFYNESGTYDENLYLNYFIDELDKTSNRIKYTMVFNLSKVNNEWKINDLTDSDVEKLHGLYNYQL